VQEETRKAENAGLTNTEPEQILQEMMVAIGDHLSDLECSYDGEDAEGGEHEETAQGKLSEDDEPGWVMGTISKTVQQRMERSRQKQMKLDKLTQPGQEDAANYIRAGDEKYNTSNLRVPAVVKLQTHDDVAAPAPITYGELPEYLDIVPRILQMPQRTTRPGSCHIQLGTGKPQSNR